MGDESDHVSVTARLLCVLFTIRGSTKSGACVCSLPVPVDDALPGEKNPPVRAGWIPGAFTQINEAVPRGHFTLFIAIHGTHYACVAICANFVAGLTLMQLQPEP